MTTIAGIDFGTTNSVVAFVDPHGTTRTATFRIGHDELDVIRSVLCFWREEDQAGSELRHMCGPEAITAYIDDPLGSRLIMSMKSFLAQKSFTDTYIYGWRYTLEQMIALFLKYLLHSTNSQPAGDLEQLYVIAGRPVKFAGEAADDAFGEQRLRAAYAQLGLAGVDTALEPEAAGYKFARTLNAPATVLVGDFGGGTSDFSVLRFEPKATRGVTSLGHSGIGIAGDTFDYRIIDNVIVPKLGGDDTYRLMGKTLPMPKGYFASFARWHRLSVMRDRKIIREIESLAKTASHPERLANLVTLIQDGVGYALYQTVAGVKAELSRQESGRLSIRHKEFAVDEIITRPAFESWIADDVRRIDETVSKALQSAAMSESDIDCVFLTGGTSFVPAVKRIFTDRFSHARIATGGEFVSVAEGLALIGRDRRAASEAAGDGRRKPTAASHPDARRGIRGG